MKKVYLLKGIIITAVFFASSVLSGANSIKEINQAIKTRHAGWIAASNPMTEIPVEQLKFLDIPEPESMDVSKVKKISLSQVTNLPSHFDWRDNNGNYVTPAKDQHMELCGSCGVFAAFAQVESWWMISNQAPGSAIDLSEQYPFSCGGFGCWVGYPVPNVMEFAMANDIPMEDCLPYQASDTVACIFGCTDPLSRTVRIPGWGYAVGCENIGYLKNAIYRQPVCTNMYVYRDFLAYTGGVYEPVTNEVTGYHSVTLIGWDDADSCWIAKNCWGQAWGEEGFFRIKWGECEMGSQIPFIWSGGADSNSIAAIPAQMDLELTLGDSVETGVYIKNSGTVPVEYLARAVRSPSEFHLDSFNSYDGLSWWCGDPLLGGYGNIWLQHLDLPVLDLSGAVNPRLSFMGFWALEKPQNFGEYDGWDGATMWISTDGGANFQVMTPDYPEYNCLSLNAYSPAVWNSTDFIPGWGGKSGGWTEASLDLTQFKSGNVVIRFSFASDLAGSVVGVMADPSFLGFFVDEIRVTDGDDVLFENDGEMKEDLFARCEKNPVQQPTDYNFEAGVFWMAIDGESGTIQAGDSSSVTVSVKTKSLEAGTHEGLIRVSSNDSSEPMMDIPVRLTVHSPEHDLVLRKGNPAGANLPLYVNNDLSAWIFNSGSLEETGVNVSCTLLKGDSPVWADTVYGLTLQPGGSCLCTFGCFQCSESGLLDMKVEILQMNSGDANPENNTMLLPLTASGLIDNFETQTNLFDYQGGWGITGYADGHSGSYAVHVNKGELYEVNANAALTLKSGLLYEDISGSEIRFWMKGNASKNKDFLYTEVSHDSLTWTALDSITGSLSKWTEQIVPLKAILSSPGSEVWIRLHFVARGTSGKTGYLVDDIGIYPAGTSAANEENIAAGLPAAWDLEQNYPNPFNASTQIRFRVPRRSHVTVQVFDMLGRETAVLKQGITEPGTHSVLFDASNQPSGIYFVRMKAGEFTKTRKCIVLK